MKDGMKECPQCKGEKIVTANAMVYGQVVPVDVACPVCKGSGEIPSTTITVYIEFVDMEGSDEFLMLNSLMWNDMRMIRVGWIAGHRINWVEYRKPRIAGSQFLLVH